MILPLLLILLLQSSTSSTSSSLKDEIIKSAVGEIMRKCASVKDGMVLK